MALRNTITKLILPLLLLLFSIPAHSARPGKADLILQQMSPGPSAAVGDTLTIILWLDAREEPITGVALYLTLDETCLKLIPHLHRKELGASGLRPFRQGSMLGGTLFRNDTLGDELDDSMANNLPGFQILYNEDITAGFGGVRRSESGKGILAEFRVKLLQPHDNPLRAIRVDHTSPTGSESGYFHKDYPGVVYTLNIAQTTVQKGDFNGDNKRDFQDFILFVQHYGLISTDETFSGIYDLDGNSQIGFGDFLHFTQVFGQ